jgi:hypothetical protein
VWVIYDVETPPNYFCVTFKQVNKDNIWRFQIDTERNINDQLKLREFIKDKRLVGFNNKPFDDHIINHIAEADYEVSNLEIYQLAQEIINENKFSPYKNSLDLMKLLYLDKIMKGLKQVAINLQHELIQDLPYAYNKFLTTEEKNEVLEYNLNDVLITERIFNHSKEEILIRLEAEKLYGINAISESRSGLANRIAEKLYADRLGLEGEDKYDFKKIKTERDSINLDNVVYDKYKTIFKTKNIQQFVKHLCKQTVYPDGEKISIDFPILNIGGLPLQFGAGGIHSVDAPGYYIRSKGKVLRDADVTSFYPFQIIQNAICPAHLNKQAFLGMYLEDMILPRVAAKKEGKKGRAEILKIVINAIYGKFTSKFHWLRDPLCGLQVTINCQLALVYLIEKLHLAGIEVISANTDGVVSYFDESQENKYNQICKSWENETRFELEFTDYDLYVRRDVNNYMARTLDGKVKTKGDFTDDGYTNLSKGYDPPIIARAIKQYYLNNTLVDETIRSSNNIHDYCKSQKSDSKFSVYFKYADSKRNTIVKKLSKTNRYYISNGRDAGTIYKESGGKVHELEADGFVILANDLRLFQLTETNKIDYSYYKRRANKIIDQIEKNRNQLTLF